MNILFVRGDIVWVNVDEQIKNSQKLRPAVIVSNNAANEMSNQVIVAPITAATENIFPFEAKIELNGKFDKILLDQVFAIDKNRICKKDLRLDKTTMTQIDKALKVALGLA